MRRYDAAPRLAELAALPTLVVSADEDLVAPAWAGRKLADGIPGAQFVQIPNAAHGMPIYYASQVNRLLREHLQRSEAAQTIEHAGTARRNPRRSPRHAPFDARS